MLTALGKYTAKNMVDFDNHALSITAWAFVKAGYTNSHLFCQLQQACLARLQDMDPQSMCCIATAFAGLPPGAVSQSDLDALFGGIVNRLQQSNFVAEFDCVGLIALATALSKCNIAGVEVGLEKILDEALCRVPSRENVGSEPRADATAAVDQLGRSTGQCLTRLNVKALETTFKHVASFQRAGELQQAWQRAVAAIALSATAVDAEACIAPGNPSNGSAGAADMLHGDAAAALFDKHVGDTGDTEGSCALHSDSDQEAVA